MEQNREPRNKSTAIPLLAIYPKNMKTQFEKIYAPQCSYEHYLQ